jgi:membrane-associated phospholipid phosphatase
MIKFSLFLILGNILNFIGISVPTSAIAFYPLFPLENLTKILRILTYIEGVFILVSLIPTPVFTLIFFRTVRYRFKYIISCSCLRVVKEAYNHMYKAEQDKATTTMNFSNPTAKSPD